MESAYDSRAGSRKKARGTWQFLLETARTYGLEVSDKFDGRHDFILATDAAARYLKEAYADFGNWAVAVSSFHHGLPGTRKIVQKTGSSDYAAVAGSFGFYSRNYWPEVLAAVEVFERREEFFPGVALAAPLSFAVYPLSRNLAAAKLCEKLAVDVGTLMLLNSGFPEEVWQGGRPLPAGYDLRIPVEADPAVIAALEAQERRSIVVKPGQTLSQIARASGVSVPELRSANGLSGDRIIAGKRLFLE